MKISEMTLNKALALIDEYESYHDWREDVTGEGGILEGAYFTKDADKLIIDEVWGDDPVRHAMEMEFFRNGKP